MNDLFVWFAKSFGYVLEDQLKVWKVDSMNIVKLLKLKLKQANELNRMKSFQILLINLTSNKIFIIPKNSFDKHYLNVPDP